MGIKVLVVDDSGFFRRRVSEIINGDPRLEVIATATNGKEAVEKAKTYSPDVITMDVEMPIMDGISAVREIMKDNPLPILMFSSITHDGAQATLDALDAGALDFLPKKFEDIAKDREQAIAQLRNRILELSRKKVMMMRKKTSVNLKSTPRKSSLNIPSATNSRTTARRLAQPESNLSKLSARLNKNQAASQPVITRKSSFKKTGKNFKLLAIGTSTGGPVALQKILTQIPANIPVPIILVQHMPGTFTTAFAARLNGLCKIKVKEAQDGDILRPGFAYLAPGGKQMMLEGRSQVARLKILESDERLNYKPCVDVTFGSAAKIFQDKVLGLVLTGMGADGREGSRMLKRQGSVIWAQDEETCVVYGMPQAVASAGISTESLSLDIVAERINFEFGI